MRNILLLLTGLCAMCAPIAAAASDTAAEKPAEIAASIQSIQPYGQSAYRWLGFKVYDATLWTDAKPWSMASPFALKLDYRMNFSRTELVARTLDELQLSHKDTEAEQAIIQKKLEAVYADVAKNDNITALYTPKKGLVFFHNGTRTSTITDDALAQRIMGIWLWDTTSAPEARARLLGDAQPTKKPKGSSIVRH